MDMVWNKKLKDAEKSSNTMTSFLEGKTRGTRTGEDSLRREDADGESRFVTNSYSGDSGPRSTRSILVWVS